MRNECCGFNFCPLIIAIFLGVLIAVLVYLGVITIISTLIPYFILTLGAILFIIFLLILNLDSINAVTTQVDCCGRYCCNPCCICPLIRNILVSLIISIVFNFILILTGVVAIDVIIAILVFVAITSYIYTLFIFVQLLFCLLNKLCNG